MKKKGTTRAAPARRPARRAASYAASGVNTAREESGLKSLVGILQATLATRPIGLGQVKLPFGYFANVVEVAGIGIAISTDGVGSKLLIAQMVDKYDTLGIDCVAMNVNDLLCVGAEPISMVDYIAVQRPDPRLLTELAKGLRDGALIAGITIPGGEIAQVRDIIKGARPGMGFDLAGAAIGTVALDRIRIGRDIEPDDVVLGLASSGVHSNGMTLARGLLKKHRPGLFVKELGRTLGEEFLEPTRIYVKEVLDVLRSGVDVKALIHITSDGLLNLLRVDNPTGFAIHTLPDAPRIFDVIRRELRVSEEEMYRVFNMGVGFCLVVSHRDDHSVRAQRILARHGVDCREIGRAVRDPARAVLVEPAGLRGEGDRFTRL